MSIDTTTLDRISIEDEQRLQFLEDQSYVLSTRLNQLRRQIRQSKRDILESETIEKQINRIREEMDELENKKYGWRNMFRFFRK